VTFTVLKLVHEFCVGHSGVGVQLAPSVFVIVTHLTFELIVSPGMSTVTVPGTECPRIVDSVGSQAAKVEVQEVLPNGTHVLGHGTGTKVVGIVAGQPQGMV
jgi:hypothetical protein